MQQSTMPVMSGKNACQMGQKCLSDRATKKEQRPEGCCSDVLDVTLSYETSMALLTFFSSFTVLGIVMVRMPSSTLAEILSRSTSSGKV